MEFKPPPLTIPFFVLREAPDVLYPSGPQPVYEQGYWIAILSTLSYSTQNTGLFPWPIPFGLRSMLAQRAQGPPRSQKGWRVCWGGRSRWCRGSWPGLTRPLSGIPTCPARRGNTLCLARALANSLIVLRNGGPLQVGGGSAIGRVRRTGWRPGLQRVQQAAIMRGVRKRMKS